MFYWNARKEIGLPHALTKRLLTVILLQYLQLSIIFLNYFFQAYHRVKFYSDILEEKLKARGMQDDSQIMTIQKNLEAEARAHLGIHGRVYCFSLSNFQL